jgi:hypothetical protein
MINNDGLDFETGTPDVSRNPSTASSRKHDLELKDIARHAFRFPIQKIGTVKVSIADHTLDLVNIVVNDTTGIGVRLHRQDIFSVDEELPVIRFKLLDKDFILTGTVQHISPDVSGHYICGIILNRLTAEDRQALRTFTRKLHAELFR